MKSDGIEVIQKRGNGLTFSEEYDMIYEYNSQEESDYIYEEIFTRQIYLKHDIAIKENDTIIDCGANIGLFSLFCIKHVKNINILCIEPLPPNNTLLKRNLSDYMSKKNLDYNIKLCNCGVGRYEEECNFYFFPDVPGESTRHLSEHKNQRKILFDSALMNGNIEIREGLFNGNDNDDNNCNNDNNDDNDDDNCNDENYVTSNKYRNVGTNGNLNDNSANYENRNKTLITVSEEGIFSCKIRTLEDIFIENNYTSIDLLKIDVEGDELEVLYGINTKFNIIKQIIIEVHDIDNRLFNVIRILKDKGFMVTFDAQETEVSRDGYMSFIPKELQLYLVYAKKIIV